MATMAALRLLLVALLNVLSTVHCDQFHESLLLRPLEDGSLFTEFKFNVITRYSDIHTSMFYHLFPKSIGELFIRLPIWEFHLTLTRGRWNYANWGSFHSHIAPYGAELRTVFYENTTSKDNINDNHNDSCMQPPEHDNEWLIFQQILSGLYCASINEINIQVVNNTNHQFIPSQLNWLNEVSDHQWSYYYGILPKENICTENLTPWSKLLPCRRNNGLALLLNPSKLFSAKYQSMQVHVTPLGNDKFMKMTQTFQAVFDMNPDHNVKGKQQSKQWDIKRLFDVKKEHMPYLNGCPVAHSSLVIFDIPAWIYQNMPSWNLRSDEQHKDAVVKPLPNVVYEYKELSEGHLWVYSLPMYKRLNTIKFEWPQQMFAYNRVQSQSVVSMNNYLQTQRYIVEQDQVQGQLVIAIKNQHSTRTIRFSYFDPLPFSL